MMYDDILFSLRTGAAHCSFSDNDVERNRILRRRVWECFYELIYNHIPIIRNECSWPNIGTPDVDDVFGDIPERILVVMGQSIARNHDGEYESIRNREELESLVCDGDWYHVYDFIEIAFRVLDTKLLETFAKDVNIILASCLSRYRFVRGYVISVLDDVELKEISDSLNWQENVSQHMADALAEYSKRISANMNKVASSAISAVEASIVSTVNGSVDTLGRAFDFYQAHCNADMKMDSNLVDAMKSLYKYTCQGGIRHGGVDYVRLDELDARFVLVVSAAMTNYLNERNQMLDSSCDELNRKREVTNNETNRNET